MIRSRSILALVTIAASVIQLHAQTRRSRLEFEVATIKPNKSGSMNSGAHIPPVGRFDATNVTPEALLRYAFDVRSFQIVGVPDWTTRERYDVIGKPPDNS